MIIGSYILLFVSIYASNFIKQLPNVITQLVLVGFILLAVLRYQRSTSREIHDQIYFHVGLAAFLTIETCLAIFSPSSFKITTVMHILHNCLSLCVFLSQFQKIAKSVNPEIINNLHWISRIIIGFAKSKMLFVFAIPFLAPNLIIFFASSDIDYFVIFFLPCWFLAIFFLFIIIVLSVLFNAFQHVAKIFLTINISLSQNLASKIRREDILIGK